MIVNTTLKETRETGDEGVENSTVLLCGLYA